MDPRISKPTSLPPNIDREEFKKILFEGIHKGPSGKASDAPPEEAGPSKTYKPVTAGGGPYARPLNGKSPTTISFRTNILDELEHQFGKHRNECVNEDGFLNTPLHVVKKMAEEYEVTLHTEVYIVHFGGPEGEDRFFRVETMCGMTRGIGQAPVKGLACQLAAIDILEKIKFYNKDQLPIYGMPPGCRVNPKVIRHLIDLCEANNCARPEIKVESSNKPFKEAPLFVCSVAVGDLVIEATSDNRFMARRLAAAEMYARLTRAPYPDMTLAIGNECSSLKRLKDFGIQPLMSQKKRDWLEQYRVDGEGKLLHFPDEEPNDGNFLDPEDLIVYENKTKSGAGMTKDESTSNYGISEDEDEEGMDF